MCLKNTCTLPILLTLKKFRAAPGQRQGSASHRSTHSLKMRTCTYHQGSAIRNNSLCSVQSQLHSLSSGQRQGSARAAPVSSSFTGSIHLSDCAYGSSATAAPCTRAALRSRLRARRRARATRVHPAGACGRPRRRLSGGRQLVRTASLSQASRQ